MLRQFIFSLTILLVAITAKAGDVKLELGTKKFTVAENGTVSIADDENGTLLNISLAFYAPGWVKCSQASAADVKADKKGKNKYTFKGTMETKSSGSSTFAQRVAKEDGKLTVEFELVGGKSFTLEKQQHPFVDIALFKKYFADKEIGLSGHVFKMPVNNKHAWGANLSFPSCKLNILNDPIRGYSIWKGSYKDEYDHVRIVLNQSEKDKWKLSLTVEEKECKATDKVEGKEAVSYQAEFNKYDKEKIEAYSRVLNYPMIEGADAAYPRKLLADVMNNGSRSNLDSVEDWLGAYSTFINLSDRYNHLSIYDTQKKKSVIDDLSSKYAASVILLNKGDLDAFYKLSAELLDAISTAFAKAKTETGSSPYPGTCINTTGWLKRFEYAGFKKNPAKCFVSIPSPWSVTFSNGDSLTLLKQEIPENEFSTRDDFALKSSWVTNQWIGSGKYTFSVLSPLIGIEGVPELYIRSDDFDFSSVKLAVSETDLTALGIDKVLGAMQTSWLLIPSKDSGYLLVIFGNKPREADAGKNYISFKGIAGSFARLMKLPAIDNQAELIGECRFWASVALAMPVQVIESRKDNTITYEYVHEEKESEWGDTARKIAPIPSLALCAGIEIQDSKKTHISTGFGSYEYTEGERLSFNSLNPKLHVWRGINVKVTDGEEKLTKFKDMGATWVRVFVGNKWKDHEEGYRVIEEFITLAQKVGLKVLLDPHDFVYSVDKWVPEVPDEPEKIQSYIDMWGRLSQISMKYPGVVVGYDIYNELKVKTSKAGWDSWSGLANKVITEIRKHDAKTPIYMTGICMANPEGFTFAQPIAQDAVYSFHYYLPHSFTHQKIDHKSSRAPFAFYPGWLPGYDWGKTHYGPGRMDWWDRWSIGAGMWPVFQFAAQNKVRMHCGEVAPIGYCKEKASKSAAYWTQDSIDWLERYQFDWNLWNQGFGLNIPEVVPVVEKAWKR
ncbi:MAG: cellulase family glycosylhydrolase [Planctomycetes bacterium]|nr:cellulase family glycosylhydrolase [Planctomycetota bacterium]